MNFCFRVSNLVGDTRIRSWGILIGKFVGVQMMVQVIGLVSGLILVRVLTKGDYALFIIANSMMGTMTQLSDSGISSGTTAIGGKVWHDRQKFGEVIATSMRLRRIFASIVVSVISPILAWLLLRNGAPAHLIVTVVLLVISATFLQISVGILSVIPRLLLATSQIQKIDFLGAITRLTLIGIFFTFLNVNVAIAVAVVAFALQWWLLRQFAKRNLALAQPSNPEMRAQIVKIVKSQAPLGIYYCFQGQLTVWLISVLGNSQGVANLGAIGRLAVMFSIVGSVITTLITPRFARWQDGEMLLRRFFILGGFLLTLCICILLAAAIAPNWFLFFLGSKYQHLHKELLFVLVSNVAAVLGGFVYNLNCARGWTVSPFFAIGLTIIVQILGILFLDCSTVEGVSILATASVIPALVMNVVLLIQRCRSLSRSTNSDLVIT